MIFCNIFKYLKNILSWHFLLILWMKPEWIKDYTCIYNQVIHSNSKHEFILTLFNKRTYMIVHVCAFFSSLNVNYTCIFIICKSMSACHYTLFAFLSAIHSNVQNCSFLYIFNCIRIIYAHSMVFFSMRLIALLVLEML